MQWRAESTVLRGKLFGVGRFRRLRLIVFRSVLVDEIFQALLPISLVAIKHLLIRNKAMQHSHDSHIKNIHEHITDKIGNQKDDNSGTCHGIQLGSNLFHNDVVAKHGHHRTYKEFSDNQNRCRNI